MSEMTLFTAEEAFEFLKKGNARRLEAIKKISEIPVKGDKFKEQRVKLLEGQNPIAVILCCSDSRFPPEIIFHNREGDLFVVRTAGHVIDSVSAGSIEYAIGHLNTPLIVVMGHDQCGAVSAAVNNMEIHGHVFNVIEHIYGAVDRIKNQPGDKISLAINQHIRNTVEYLKNLEPMCKKYYQEGKINIIGARCSIETYHVDWFE